MRGRDLDLVAQIEDQMSRLNLSGRIETVREALTAAELSEQYRDLIKGLDDMRVFRNKAAHARLTRSMQRVEDDDGSVGVHTSRRGSNLAVHTSNRS
jgi:hypothetical protein